METCLPEDIDRRSHSHLVGIEIPAVELRKVSVFIGKDVNKVHEVFEVRKSNKLSLITNCKLCKDHSVGS